MSRGELFICRVVALLVAVAPLPFGSVEPIPAALLQVCLVGLTILWIVLRSRAGLTALPWSDPFLIGGAALAGYGLLQLTPFPFAMIESLSPATAAIKRVYLPEPTGWTSLSLHPYATWMSCLRVCCWTLAAMLVRHNSAGRRARMTIALGLVVGGLFQAVYGLFEFISGRQHIFSYAKTAYADVATGTFINRNSYAGFLEMAIPMALAVAAMRIRAASASGSTRQESGTRWHAIKRRLAAATGRESFGALMTLMGAFLMATALTMSRSRMGIISMATALGLGGLVLALGGRTRRFALVLIGVVLVATLFASQIDILPVVDRFASLRDEFGTGYGRLQVWKAATALVAANPIFGTGFGTWEMAFSPFRTDNAQFRVDFAHNDYLEFLAEGGVIGAALLLLAIWLVLRRRAREQDTPTTRDEITLAAGIGFGALALHSMTDFHFSIPANAFGAAVLAGLLARRHESDTPEERHPRWSARGARMAAGVACALGLAALALSAVPPALAQARSLVLAAPSASSGTPADPARDPDSGPIISTAGSPDDELCPACGDEPSNATLYFQAVTRARLRLVADVATIRKAQHDGIVPDPVVRIYLARRIEAAIELARRGLELAPVSGRGHLETALLRFGRFELIGLPPADGPDFAAALNSFDKALNLQPWFAASHRKAARLLAPYYDQSLPQQRLFIARVTRRAFELNPWAADMRESLERMEPQ